MAKKSASSNDSKVRRRTLRRMRHLLVTGAAAGVYACGGPTVADPLPPPPTTTIPASASVTIELWLLQSFASDRGSELYLELFVSETVGIGANIDFLRGELLRANGDVEERQEIGSGQVIERTGSNRLEGNETRLLAFGLRFNANIAGRPIRITVGLTDDLGNDISESYTIAMPL